MPYRAHKSNSHRRGNAFVEAGLVLVPFLAIVLGITEYSLALFVRTTMQHAVREGVRYAVTYQLKGGMCHDASIKEVVRTNAVGFLKPADVATKVFVRYYLPTTFAAAPAPANSPGNIVEISVENYQWRWIAPLWRTSTPLTIVARSTDIMEGLPGGANPPCR